LLLCVSHSLPITSSLFPSPSWYLETRITPENSHWAVFPFNYCFFSSILTSSLFLSTLRTVLFHYCRFQFSDAYKIKRKIALLYILICALLQSSLEEKIFLTQW
jgi:hypothetical protein